ncbi:DUF1279 domain-containing protein [Fusarium falciforme]|uniref:DUF1279 domain-containing protein n=1 Tax=Fusarium falciforme TaxID=195108 RepID=UPI0022FFDF52|nr:DUF1279 domain-containing protein [Fusarium falciforme]WAO89557.1 DUF1279 domain-containing protein [Fusarium falciforme]
MLRQPLRGVRAPLRTFDQAAWKGAWRKFFTSQTGDKASRQLWRLKTASWESMLARLRSTRFGTGSTTTPGMMQGLLRRGFRFTARRKGAKGPVASDAEKPMTLTARLKKLTKDYGWATVGVYLGLSVLDFPFCFLFVRIVGAETIGKVEHYVVSSVKAMIPDSVRETWHEYWQSFKKAEVQALGDDDISDKMEMATWSVEKAQERNRAADASLATQLALAYAIHKSFIVFRVPLTAAVTPKVVKVLRSWGWKIGKKSG